MVHAVVSTSAIDQFLRFYFYREADLCKRVTPLSSDRAINGRHELKEEFVQFPSTSTLAGINGSASCRQPMALPAETLHPFST